MKATFENSINVLVKAYLNGTLQYTNCYACAVGNLVADANKIKHIVENGIVKWESNYPIWLTNIRFGEVKDRNSASKEQGDSTGYTQQEIAKIECAFEYGYPLDFSNPVKKDCDGYLGLMRVVDVLAEIHNIDLEAKESAKQLFVKA